MSFSLRRSALSLAALAALASSVGAQGTGRPQVMPAGGQNVSTAASGANVGGLGSAATTVPAGVYGYSPYNSAGGSYGPGVASGGGGSNPYGLSTVGSYNPYTAPAGTMTTTPYGMGGSPAGPAIAPFPISPFGFGDIGLIGAGPGVGYGAAMQGLASYTQASGRYWGDLQSARMTREQVRQMQIETKRRQVEYELWYEQRRPKAPDMIAAEKRTELDRARQDPPDTEVVAGKSLNVLLKSIQNTRTTGPLPNVPLDDGVLKKVNLTGGGSGGNLGMIKDGVNLAWPEGLQDTSTEQARNKLKRNLQQAVSLVKDKEEIPRSLTRDISSDFKAINDKLNESAEEMPPSQFIEARRYMNQISSSIRALSDPNVGKSVGGGAWTPKGKSVADLVKQMTDDGLTFAAAGPGEDAAYRALYQAMRNYEMSLQLGQR